MPSSSRLFLLERRRRIELASSLTCHTAEVLTRPARNWGVGGALERGEIKPDWAGRIRPLLMLS